MTNAPATIFSEAICSSRLMGPQPRLTGRDEISGVQDVAGAVCSDAVARPPALLVALRAATLHVHARIETLPGLAQLMSPALTAPEYLQVLRGLYAFHARMRATLPGLLASLESSPDAPWRKPVALTRARAAAARRCEEACAALERDIRFFGARPGRAAPPVAALRDARTALGALYVVEGALLGGRVVARAVEHSVQAVTGCGGDFFNLHDGPTAQQRRQALCDVLRAAPSAWRARVIDGALAAFATLEHALDRPARFRSALELCGEKGSLFFFEKKNQKTFISWAGYLQTQLS